MVPLGSAQCTRASETQAMERVVFVSIILLKRSALLMAAAATLLERGFACDMVHGESVLLKDVMLVLSPVVSARSIVPNQSALGNGAPQPLLEGEGASSTAVAIRKCAR